MRDLGNFLRSEKAAGKEIYPPGAEFFAALQATPPKQVKVVILGQDPYHGPGQAHGLSFRYGVANGYRPPCRTYSRSLPMTWAARSLRVGTDEMGRAGRIAAKQRAVGGALSTQFSPG